MKTIKTAYGQEITTDGKPLAFTLIEVDNGNDWIYFDVSLTDTPEYYVATYLRDRDLDDEIIFDPENEAYTVEGVVRACTMKIPL